MEAGGVDDANGPGRGGDGYVCDITGTASPSGGGGAAWRTGKNIPGGNGGGSKSLRSDCVVKEDNSTGVRIAGTGCGDPNTGGGGAGGAAGGSGVFIVRYAIKPLGTIICVR